VCRYSDCSTYFEEERCCGVTGASPAGGVVGDCLTKDRFFVAVDSSGDVSPPAAGAAAAVLDDAFGVL
jgi:hypothetical protein